MKLPRHPMMAISWAAILLVAVLTATVTVHAHGSDPTMGVAATSPRNAPNPPPIATPTATASSESDQGSASADAQQPNETGDIIRQRVIRTAIAGSAVAAGLLLLLWVYTSLRDPIQRHRASMRIRQLRREERKDRARRRRNQ
jgi:hypothetical protein